MNPRIARLAALLCLINVASPQQKKPAPPSSKRTESAEQVYRNPAFGFRYNIPYGWVDRTREMQEGHEPGKGEVLLAIFERPPQAAGETINSAVVITAESVASDPGVKKPEDYLGPLTEATTSKGFKAEGDLSELHIDSQRLVRADFTKPINQTITMRQSTLLMLARGQIVSFTFIADTADAVNDLIERTSFQASKSKPE